MRETEEDGRSRRGGGDWENGPGAVIALGWMHVGDKREQTYKYKERDDMKNDSVQI